MHIMLCKSCHDFGFLFHPEKIKKKHVITGQAQNRLKEVGKRGIWANRMGSVLDLLDRLDDFQQNGS